MLVLALYVLSREGESKNSFIFSSEVARFELVQNGGLENHVTARANHSETPRSLVSAKHIGL